MVNHKIYLDNAAATPLDKNVFLAMEPYFADYYFNPSANYSSARKVFDAISKARSNIAEVLSVKPEEIYFTAGGTEANNLAIQGVMDLNPGKNMIISAIEHESVVGPASKYEYRIAPVDNSGRVIISELEKLIDENTVLISIMYANNEIGTIAPMIKIKQVITRTKLDRVKAGNTLPIYFHTDACQAANYLSLNADGLGVDMMTINGGKIYGPKQSGALFIHRGINLSPQILGGGQEHGLRSGTENVPAIIGLSVALKIAHDIMPGEVKRLEGIQEYFITRLNEIIPNCSINGSTKYRLPNNLNVLFPDQDNEMLLYKLDQAGFMCSTGSACSAQKDTISTTLLAIGLSEAQALSSLRFSMGRQTTKKQINDTIGELQKILS